MASLNKVMLIGNLGKDPDVRYTPAGKAVASFSIATNERWKDKQSGENQEKVEWHRIVMFDRLAEIAAEYLRKGSPVYIEGKLQTRSWDDKNNPEIKHYTTEVVGFQMQMLGKKEGNRPPHPAEDGSTSRPQSAPPSGFDDDGDNHSDPAGKQDSRPPADFDDDIPF